MHPSPDTGLAARFCSQRVCELTPFLVMEILEKAHAMERRGIDVVHLEVGEPDFDTPPAVIEAAAKAMADGHTHYTHSMGLPELREAIAGHYRQTYGVTVHPDRILVTQGTSPAMFMLFSALLEPGDSVIVSDPHYACYPNFIRFAHGEPRLVRASEADGFQLRPEAVRRAVDGSTRAVLVNSPSNPAGTLMPDETTRALADLSAPGGGRPWLVSDEIYHGLVYEGRERSVLEFTDHCFVLGGFSKLWAMTGWRLGWLVAPASFVRGLQVMCQNFFISANAVAQWAGIAALRDTAADVARMKDTYDQRRRFMIRRLREIGFGISVEPTGAFYVLANARPALGRRASDSLALAGDILERAHVGVTPGIDFGPGAEGCIRFSYANSIENIAEAMDRLERYVAEAQGE